MARKKPRKNNWCKYLKKRIPEVLIASGIFLILISLTHNLLRARALRLEAATLDAYNQANTMLHPDLVPVYLTIPWNSDVAISTQVFEQGVWTISPDQASYLASSARPSQSGNIIIYGHNKREILGNIRALQGGEQITLTLQNGSRRKYQVVNIAEVKPSETSLLLPTSQETLTLYTCSGPLDSLRFVVQAKPLPDQDAVF